MVVVGTVCGHLPKKGQTAAFLQCSKYKHSVQKVWDIFGRENSSILSIFERTKISKFQFSPFSSFAHFKETKSVLSHFAQFKKGDTNVAILPIL